MICLNAVEVFTICLKYYFYQILIFLPESTQTRGKKDKEKVSISLESIDSFQSFSSLHYFILTLLLNLNKFKTVSLKSVDLVKPNQSNQPNQPHQPDSKYQDNSNILTLSTYINITEKISHNSEPHISIMNNHNNDADQS